MRWAKSQKEAKFHFWFLTIMSLILLIMAFIEHVFTSARSPSSPLGFVSALLLALASFAYSDYHYYEEKES